MNFHIIMGRKYQQQVGTNNKLAIYLLVTVGLGCLPDCLNSISVSRTVPSSSSQQGGELEPPVQASSQMHKIYYHFDKRMNPYMQLHKFDPETSNTTTCNDGSQAGYYKRLNNHSKSWIIYLQGGGYCGSDETCQQRWLRTPNLMSSNYWPQTKSVDGILSSEPNENPYLWNANHVYVPYCSSDSWTGLAEAHGPERPFAFMGSKILERTMESLFEDLPKESSLYEAKFILLAGDSAGATGIILNLDKVNRFIHQKFNTINRNNNSSMEQIQANQEGLSGRETATTVQQRRQPPILRGLADSGWFLDNEPYDYNNENYYRQQLLQALGITSGAGSTSADDFLDCDKHRCTPLQSIRQAMLYWNGQVPSACMAKHLSEPWRCYFGYRAYPTLKTPLFVVQWLYDEAQLLVDNIGRPDTSSKWNYVNKMANKLKVSLENVTALFAPSCFSHSLVIKQTWNQININGLKLPHVLNSWEEEVLSAQPTFETLLASEQESMANIQQYQSRETDRMPQSQLETRSTSGFGRATSGVASITAPRTKSRKRKRQQQHQQQQNNPASNGRVTNTNRLSRSTGSSDDPTLVISNNVPDNIFVLAPTSSRNSETEKFRLVDSCGWPQCNRDCPILESDYNLSYINAQ